MDPVHVVLAIAQGLRLPVWLLLTAAAVGAHLIIATRRLLQHHRDTPWQRGYNRGCRDCRAGRNRHLHRPDSPWSRGYSHGWYDELLHHDPEDGIPF